MTVRRNVAEGSKKASLLLTNILSILTGKSLAIISFLRSSHFNIHLSGKGTKLHKYLHNISRIYFKIIG